MESAKFPELGKRFLELGPKRAEQALAAYLTKQAQKGCLSNEDTHQMAQHFMSLITGGRVRWFVLGFDPSSLSERIPEAPQLCDTSIYEGLRSHSSQLGWQSGFCSVSGNLFETAEVVPIHSVVA
jgi:AefR-like transcriptional repressor, C-terminal domain